ncbi:MAG TPA: hypothetical protein VJM32_02405 [Candidatus Saccharimonadales bacterium]|nr:hypothetical protein [Candidatus Saccharimonadales bacterium]
MLESTLPGVWHIQGTHENMRLAFHDNRTWYLGGTKSPAMSGTWETTYAGVTMRATQVGSAAGRGLAIAAAGLVLGLSLGTAVVVAPAVIAGIVASNAQREGNPGPFATFGRFDVFTGRAVAEYQLVTESHYQVVMRCDFRNGSYSDTHLATLTRVA